MIRQQRVSGGCQAAVSLHYYEQIVALLKTVEGYGEYENSCTMLKQNLKIFYFYTVVFQIILGFRESNRWSIAIITTTYLPNLIAWEKSNMKLKKTFKPNLCRTKKLLKFLFNKPDICRIITTNNTMDTSHRKSWIYRFSFNSGGIPPYSAWRAFW